MLSNDGDHPRWKARSIRDWSMGSLNLGRDTGARPRAPCRHPSLQVRLRQIQQAEGRSRRWAARILPRACDTPSSPVRATPASHSAARPPRPSQNRHRVPRALRSFSLRRLLEGSLDHPWRTAPTGPGRGLTQSRPHKGADARESRWVRPSSSRRSREPVRRGAGRMRDRANRIGSRGLGLPALTPTRVGRLQPSRKTRQTA